MKIQRFERIFLSCTPHLIRHLLNIRDCHFYQLLSDISKKIAAKAKVPFNTLLIERSILTNFSRFIGVIFKPISLILTIKL